MKNSIGVRPIKKANGRESEVMLSSYDLGVELEVISKKFVEWRRSVKTSSDEEAVSNLKSAANRCNRHFFHHIERDAFLRKQGAKSSR